MHSGERQTWLPIRISNEPTTMVSVPLAAWTNWGLYSIELSTGQEQLRDFGVGQIPPASERQFRIANRSDRHAPQR